MRLNNPHCLLMPLVVAAATLVLGVSDVRAEPGPCPGGVRMSGPPDLVQALQDEFLSPVDSGSACSDVIIQRDGSGLRLTLRRGKREVSRDVDDVRMASVWLRTWLMPLASDVSAPVEDAGVSEVPDEAALTVETSPAAQFPALRSPADSWSIALNGRLGLDDDIGTLGGVDVSVVGAVSEHMCLGGALGWVWADDGDDGVPWDDFHASLRGGAFTDLYNWRLQAMLGLGLFTGAVGPDGAKTLDSGSFGELVLEGAYPLSRSWSLSGGLGTRMSFSSSLNRWNNEDNGVVEIPALVVSMSFGLVYAFGGGE